MRGLPMDVCVALGLLLSELCDEPWRHRVITFSERPQLHHVKGKTLWEKTWFIRDMHWDVNTDVQAWALTMLKLFLDGANAMTPRAVMEKAISGPEYEKLIVFD
ncbi:hypothetical protein ACQ4PT_056828 [Festuca glaucescens]